MNFQYYETLMDKSEKNLFFLIEKIIPQFTINELKIFFEDVAGKKDSSSNPIKGFVEIGEDYDTIGNVATLKTEQLETMYKFFISREVNNKLVVKWRFYQYLKYIPDFVIENIRINRTSDTEQFIDLIIELEDDKIILVICYDKLDLDNFNEGIIKLNEFVKEHKINPERVIFATNKSYRNIPIDKPIDIDNTAITPELWVEWLEQKCPFNGDDLIIINNNDLELAGFNFISISDLLDYIYEFSEGDQVSIYKQSGYFSENSKGGVQNVELIWKGIMVKQI